MYIPFKLIPCNNIKKVISNNVYNIISVSQEIKSHTTNVYVSKLIIRVKQIVVYNKFTLPGWKESVSNVDLSEYYLISVECN